MFRARPFSIIGKSRFFPVPFVITALLGLPGMAMAKTVLIETPLGDIEIELLEEDAPKTVANFLNYIESGRYDKTFIHRNASGFVIQGGGFAFIDGAVPSIETFPSVENEFKVSNTRGTVAMAKIGGQPDSATSQWFINIKDNSASLDVDNGGYTVFARVIGDGMDVVEDISALPTWDARAVFGVAFGELPLIDFLNNGTPVAEENMVMTAVSEKPEAAPFVMNAGLNDAWYDPDTDGQGFFITVFPDLNFISLAWFTYDTDLPPDDATANLGDPGHRWMTAAGTIEGNRAVMDITITRGGLFDTATETQRTDPPGSDGTITLTFDDCSAGLVEYDITSINQQGTVPIQRVVGDNIALCEALITGE
jgi:cyclophilin family peptidyl-prolyl cis-trans isomerase